MPRTRLAGKPERCWARWVISSSGLVTTTMTADGAYRAMASASGPTISALAWVRSVRVIPGLRARPAVSTT